MNGRRIKMAGMDPEIVKKEIGDFVVSTVVNSDLTGYVIGLSGGVDSSTTAALIKTAFDEHGEGLEIIGYMLPSSTNKREDTELGVRVAEHLGIRYEVCSIEDVVEAYRTTNPEAFEREYDKGNLMSRIRANVLSTKAATEKKIVAGTGNRDEDFGIGYYTLFGDGAVHISPIGNLSKRLVREMATYLGLDDAIVNREPTAGLENGQTDFKDLGYYYDLVEVVTNGIEQGFTFDELKEHDQVVPLVNEQNRLYEKLFGYKKFQNVEEVIYDIFRRYHIAREKARIIHPPVAPVSLEWR
jgi:NAD+ synthase